MNTKDLIIIGGGVAGLSSAIYARLNGIKVTLLEMHERPGGQLTSWARQGYRFDYCLHWLVGTDHGVYHDIWRETGAITDQVEVVNHDVFVRLVDGEEGEFYMYNNLSKWEDYLIAMAPEDEKAIRKLCHMMKKSNQLDQFEEPPGLRSIGDYVKMVMHAVGFFPILIKYGKSTAKQLFNDLHFTNKRLLFFLNKFFGGKDFSALGFMMMLGWADAKNAGYLQGGSIKMADRMASKAKALGTEFKFNAKVKDILVEKDTAMGVILEGGEKLYADHVISACDGHSVLYDMLKGAYLNEEFRKAYENWDLFTPLVMVSFGIDEELYSKSHNTVYFPDKDTWIGNTKVESYSLLNRSMYDSAFAPRGKSVLLMQFESPWKVWEDLKGAAYLEEKEAIRKKAVSLLGMHYPDLPDKIEVIDIATPRTTVRYTGVWKGAYEGFRPSTDVLNGLPMKLEGLKNFTMTGQWLFPGGGLPPSAQSGKWAIRRICHDEKRTFNTT